MKRDGAPRAPWAYRLLLRLYPAEFRVRYADDMVDALHERLAESRRRGTLRARLGAWLIVLEDALRSIPREHRLARRNGRDEPLTRLPRSARPGAPPPLPPDRSPARAALMDSLFQDLAFALRGLRARPALTLLILATLALGIGATTTIFSVLDGVVLRALPYPDSDRLVLVGSESQSFSAFGPVSGYAFSEWRDDVAVFEGMAAVAAHDQPLTSAGSPTRLTGAAVAHEFFPLLGASTAIGRGILPEDDRAASERVVVITHGLWQRRWGGDPELIGREITLGGQPHVVIGVLTPDFVPPDAVGIGAIDFLVPLAQASFDLADRDNYVLRVIARLADGVGVEAARDALMARAEDLQGSGDHQIAELSLVGPNVGRSDGPGDRNDFGARDVIEEDSAELTEETVEIPLGEETAEAGGNMTLGESEDAPGDLERAEAAGPERAETNRIVVADEPDFRPAVVSMKERVVGDSDRTLLLLTGAVGFLLMIACVNVANLLLALATDRGREISLRTALGANRARIVRQLLTESVALGVAGGIGGCLLALGGVRLFVALNPGDLPRLQQVTVDARVLLFTLAISVLTGLVFGVVPAWILSRRSLSDALKESVAMATGGSGRSRFRGLLVALETALAVVLLVGAGLLVNSFVRLATVDPGFEPRNLTTLRLELGDAYAAPEAQARFVSRLIEDVAPLPGVERVAATSLMPFGGEYTMGDIGIEEPAVPIDGVEFAGWQQVTPGYFEAMGIRVLHGRAFTVQELEDGTPVAVVNEAMARKYWQRSDVVGMRMRAGGPEQPWMTVVGVVGNVRQHGLRGGVTTDFFMPYSGGIGGRRFHLVARMAPGAPSIAAALRARVAAIDPTIPTDRLHSMRELISGSVDEPRFYAALLGAFAAIAALLAAIGIYGSVSWAVGQRTREIGIRRALGARTADLVRTVTRQGLAMAAIGLVAGLLGAWLLSSTVEGFLFGIDPTDAPTFAGVAIGLAVVALIACLLPARRATSIDPMVALRE